jgi:alkaline phosphatase D
LHEKSVFMKKVALLLILSIVFLQANAQLPPMPPRPGVDKKMGPFYHGVASGDPLSDRVIIWTRVTPSTPGTITVNWQVATDTLFTTITSSGTTTTDSTKDYTVKVDATGLTANRWYYYRFKVGSMYSIIGRTRTLPVGSTDSIRFAVFSCSDFQGGYFNAYNHISKRNDLDVLIHLGDWYYEYESGGWDYKGDTNRLHPFAHDSYSLSDYRLVESMYKLDKDVIFMLEQYPIIQLWDDHEVCDNASTRSGLNHNAATQGAYLARKNASRKAFLEWNPIRTAAPGNDSIIHRSFKWGDLLDLIMLDSRLEGRDSALGTMLSSTEPYMVNPSRSMLGTTQLNWLKTELSDASTQWKIIGNAVMIAQLYMFGSVANGDQWDGYPAERKRIFDHISQNNIKDVVFLSGDLHSSWAGDLPDTDSTYVASTGAGSVGTEFIGGSITSESGYSIGVTVITLSNPWFKYVDLTLHGYLLFDVNKTRAQGDFIHVNTVASKAYTTSNDAQWMHLNNERHLQVAPGPLGSNTGNPPLVTFNPLSVPETTTSDFVVFTCYPNPAHNDLTVQFSLNEASKMSINITDLTGKLVYNGAIKHLPAGINNINISLADLNAGVYLVSLIASDGLYTTKVIKDK